MEGFLYNPILGHHAFRTLSLAHFHQTQIVASSISQTTRYDHIAQAAYFLAGFNHASRSHKFLSGVKSFLPL
jgi:hypothetical protein